MKIKYIGGLPDGFIRTPAGKRYTFKNGEPLELPNEIADELLAQSEPDPTLENLENRKNLWEEVK